MASVGGFVRRVWAINHPPEAIKSADAVRIGLFGASWIAPSAVIIPAKSHPDVIVAAIAARDESKARAYAKKHGIPNVHKSYEDLLADATIDAVYIPLPNSLHYEWAKRALRAGKHVLLEKPSVSNAAEATSLFNFHASLPNAPVLLEAFHYLFHPAWQTFLSLLDPPSVSSAQSFLSAPAFFFPKDDIRFKYSLSGGALMDMGTYNISTLRQVFGAEPEECLSAEPRIMPKGSDQQCDQAMKASWRFPNGGVGSTQADLSNSRWGLPMIETPKVVVKHKEVAVTDEDAGLDLNAGDNHTRTRTVTLWNFVVPVVWHRIDIVDEHVLRKGKVIKKWTTKESKKAYTWGDLQEEGMVRVGQEYWSTYRHMLEQFINKIKGRQGSGVWVDGEDSIKQMKMIDDGYQKAGLPIRPTSEFINE